MSLFGRLLGLLFVAACSFPSGAQELPSKGSVTSVEENSGLTFECTGQGLTANCSFVQTIVSQEDAYTVDEIETFVQQLRGDDAIASMCGEFLQQLIVVRDGGNFGVALTPRDRADASDYATVLEAFCRQKTPEAARAVVTHLEERKSQSCKIGTLTFDLTFNWNSASQRLESVSTPEGSCGVVTMSFMEQDKDRPYFWNYREQTIVTNRAGTDPLLGDCSGRPEGEQVYTWVPDTLKRSCEYVSFGF
jgi:hypothetical protein